MHYNDVFVAQKKAEGKYNENSDKLAEEIIQEYESYVNALKEQTEKNDVNALKGQTEKNVRTYITRTRRYAESLHKQEEKHLFNGLVIGYVQSGKTMNFCHVINRAIDAGFRLIVVLTDNNNDLNIQTIDRIADDIVGEANPSVHEIKAYQDKKGHDFVSFYGKDLENMGITISSAVNQNMYNPDNPLTYNGKVSVQDRIPKVYWLTACDKGTTRERKNLDFRINHASKNNPDTLDTFLNNEPKDKPAGCYIAVVKKNPTSLSLLRDFLKGSSIVDNHEIKALFIDDECDKITVAGKGSSRGKKKKPAITSSIIKEIQELFKTKSTDPEHSMYIEYSATPIANICVHNRVNANIPGFPDDFIKILDKPNVYCGFEAYGNYHGIVNVLPSKNQSVDFIPRNPVTNVSFTDCKKNAPQLYNALIQFIWNCKIFEERNKSGVLKENTTSMLVHTNPERDVHEVERDYIEDVLQSMSEELLKELDDIYNNHSGNYTQGTGNWDLIDDFYARYKDIKKKMMECYKNGYYKDDTPFDKCSIKNYPGNEEFDIGICNDLLSYIVGNTLSGEKYHRDIQINSKAKKIQVIEINSKSKNKLPDDENFIAVGGNKIARGLTLHNLSVTYFTRGTRAMDTLTQMARWLGYRIGYFDICRLYIDNYAPVSEAAGIEQKLHEMVKEQTKQGIPPCSMTFTFFVKENSILSNKEEFKIRQTCNAARVFETTNVDLRGLTRFINDIILQDFYDVLAEKAYHPVQQGDYGCLDVLTNSKANPERYCYVKDVDFEIVKKYVLDRFATAPTDDYHPNVLKEAATYMEACGVDKLNVLLSGRGANADKIEISFQNPENSLPEYKVVGLAYKTSVTLDKNNNEIAKISSFEDCYEDFVVDYPYPSTLNDDFNKFVGGTTYFDNRDKGYETNVKTFGRENREKPLMIITPFVFAEQTGLPDKYTVKLKDINRDNVKGKIYYSISIVLPFDKKKFISGDIVTI